MILLSETIQCLYIVGKTSDIYCETVKSVSLIGRSTHDVRLDSPVASFDWTLLGVVQLDSPVASFDWTAFYAARLGSLVA